MCISMIRRRRRRRRRRWRKHTWQQPFETRHSKLHIYTTLHIQYASFSFYSTPYDCASIWCYHYLRVFKTVHGFLKNFIMYMHSCTGASWWFDAFWCILMCQASKAPTKQQMPTSKAPMHLYLHMVQENYAALLSWTWLTWRCKLPFVFNMVPHMWQEYI